MQKGLDEGGLGLGMGITYTPTATPDEILSLFDLAARFKRPVFVHMRSGNVIASLQEVIADAAASGAPLHIVHINSAATTKTAEALRMIEGAKLRGLDVTTEAYPYIGSATWTVPRRTRIGNSNLPLFRDTSVATHGRAPDPRVLCALPPAGRRRHSLWQQRRHDTARGVQPVRDGGQRWSTGTSARSRHVRPHPGALRARGKSADTDGCHPQVLAYARAPPGGDSSPDAPEGPGSGRRRRRPCRFDPLTVTDNATWEKPMQYSSGFRYVLVGGTFVVRDGKLRSGVHPGQGIHAN